MTPRILPSLVRPGRPAVTAATAVLIAVGLGAVAMTPATATTLPPRGIRAAATSGPGAYHPITPTRLLDTRNGLGAVRARVGAGATVTLQVAGRGGVPRTGVSAVVLDLIGVSPTAGTYVTAYPADSARPGVSSLNLDAATVRANLVTVPLHADGTIALYNAVGSLDLVADVVGLYAGSATVAAEIGASGGFAPVTPRRLFDSRSDGVGVFVGGDLAEIPVSLSDAADVGVRALVLTVTVTGATSPGYVRLWGAATPEPGTSSLNFSPGVDIANTAIVRVGPCGSPCGPALANLLAILTRAVFQSATGQAHVVIDLVGVTTTATAGVASASFRALPTPQRIVDSRPALGTTTLGPGSTAVVTTPTSLLGSGPAAALAANVTLVTPSSASYLTAWRAGAPWPATSMANTAKGHVVAAGTTVELDAQGRFAVRNAAGTAAVVVDASGTFVTPSGGTLAPLAVRALGQRPIRSGPRPVVPKPPAPAPVPAPDPAAVAEGAINADINAYRTSHGRAPLVRDARIDAVARGWSRHMAATAVLDHRPDYPSLFPAGWQSAGENIVMTRLPAGTTPAAAAQWIVDAWVHSPGHLVNLFSAAYTHTGIGVARSADGTWWATQDFAEYR